MKELYRRVECSWCKLVMRPAQDDGSEVSHSCCCACKAKYFPTLGDASECQMECIESEHHDDEVESTFNPFSGAIGYRKVSFHVDTYECKVCKRLEIRDEEDCCCGDSED